MNEERTTDTIQGIRHRTKKSHPNCSVCDRLSVASHSNNHITSTQETIKEIDKTIANLRAVNKAIQIQTGLYNAIAQIEQFKRKG